jgi:HAE1 family hydrophobic/amphiphilic exporter-1
VELGVETYNAFTRMNGKPCAMIALYQAPGSNAVALAEQVKTTMAELARSFPKSMRYDISLDTTTAITAGIDEIIETLFIALALVILVVFIFIQDWRATLIPTIAIPVSLLGHLHGLSHDRLYHQCPFPVWAWCWPSASWWTMPSLSWRRSRSKSKKA